MIVSTTVCYKPNLIDLASQLRALREQVNHIIVVNNGAEDSQLGAVCGQFEVQLISLGDNLGLAFAQNVGIEHAIKRGAEFVLLMDQDSVPTAEMVLRLQRVLNADPRAAAAAPSTVDLRNNHVAYFQIEGRFWPGRWHPGGVGNARTVEASQFIASGTLIRTGALASIGVMRADWFIDQIDTEWCFRARSKGWTLIGVADATLGHQLGDHAAKVWLWRSRQVAFHSPLRHYYMFRNTVLLIGLSYTPGVWKVHLILRLMKLFTFFLIFAPQRRSRFSMMRIGLLDGVRGRTGRFAG